jgi:hypothetical protein
MTNQTTELPLKKTALIAGIGLLIMGYSLKGQGYLSQVEVFTPLSIFA